MILYIIFYNILFIRIIFIHQNSIVPQFTIIALLHVTEIHDRLYLLISESFVYKPKLVNDVTRNEVDVIILELNVGVLDTFSTHL